MHLGLHHSENLLTAALLRGNESALVDRFVEEDPAAAIAELVPRLLEQMGAGIDAVTMVTLSGLLEADDVLSAQPSLLLITTDGFSDVLILGRQRRWALYDNSPDRPKLLVPRHRILSASERMLADGTEHMALDETRLCADLAKWHDNAVDAVAISLLHAYANDVHERRVAEIVRNFFPNVSVSCSAELAPVMREFERTTTTVINAACAVLLRKRMGNVSAILRSLGCDAPVRLTTGQGLALPLAGAQSRPATVLYGARGATAIAAARSKLMDAGMRFALDMNDSSAAIVSLGETAPNLSDQLEIGMQDDQPFSGWPLVLPMARATVLGKGVATRVGVWMESIVFGDRVPEPTATLADALNVAGWSDRGVLAAQHLQAAVAQPLGLELREAACAVLEVAVATFAEAARLHLVGDGVDPESATLIGVGSWAPALAPAVALHLGCQQLIVPIQAAASGALGAALAATGLEQVATANLDFNTATVPALKNLFSRLAENARTATGLKAVKGKRMVQLRARGAGVELVCALPDGIVNAETIELVRKDFVARYRAQHPDHPLDPQAPLTASAVRLRLIESGLQSPLGACRASPQKTGSRRLCFKDGRTTSMRTIGWTDLTNSGAIDGPAIVLLVGTELILPPGTRASIHAGYALVVTRQEG